MPIIHLISLCIHAIIAYQRHSHLFISHEKEGMNLSYIRRVWSRQHYRNNSCLLAYRCRAMQNSQRHEFARLHSGQTGTIATVVV